jgi:hypothetical protein
MDASNTKPVAGAPGYERCVLGIKEMRELRGVRRVSESER